MLAVDAVQQANSGHPGLPMEAAPIAYVLWMRLMRYNPRNPDWPNRDRFVLSGGHGSMLLYAMLHLTGYDLSLDEIRNFRQWESLTPGHPEYGETPGVETTTGPLGQGIGTAVGMAMAEAHLAARFNTPGHEIVNHYTYVIASDGDMMEGVASEACSLAGHLGLGRLIVIYLDNQVTIDGATDLAFSENTGLRFDAYGWHVQRVMDGNDLARVEAAIEMARNETDRPSIIVCRTVIGYGSPNKAGTSKAHGEPLGEEEVELTKRNLGWPTEPKFFVADEVREYFQQMVLYGRGWELAWQQTFEAYAAAFPKLAESWQLAMDGELPSSWDENLPTFAPDQGPMATRQASGVTINALSQRIPGLLGGSADLAGSNNTTVEAESDFSADNHDGRTLHFGVREHAMAAALNGMTLHGGLRPYAGTFLDFFGLHAASHPPGGPDGHRTRLRLHPRQCRTGRRRANPPAHRTLHGAAGDPQPDPHPACRRRRDVGSMGGGASMQRRSRRPVADPPEAPRAGPGGPGARLRTASGGLCPGGFRRSARRDPHRIRLGGVSRPRRPGRACRRRYRRPRGQHAELGAVRSPV